MNLTSIPILGHKVHKASHFGCLDWLLVVVAVLAVLLLLLDIRTGSRIIGVVYDWLRGRRLLAVLLALVLVAVPTAFGVFPELVADVTLGDRAWIMGAWVGVAGFTALAALTEKSEGQSLAKKSQQLLLRNYVKGVVDPRISGVDPLYEISVYLDGGDDCLLPWLPHRIEDLTDPRVFKYGEEPTGATGYAFQGNYPVAVVGDAVSSAEYGLTPEQQAFFNSYQVVVAVPITNRQTDRPIGVLTVISTFNDQSFITDDEEIQAGIEILEHLAVEIGDAFSD